MFSDGKGLVELKTLLNNRNSLKIERQYLDTMSISGLS